MITIILGLIVGLVLGLTGAGGSVIAVPLLMWGMGWTLPQAAPVALLAVSASAALGAISAWKQDIVRYRAAMVMAGTGLLTAPLGLMAGDHLPVTFLNLVFAAVLLLIAFRMLKQARQTPDETRIVRASVQHDGSELQGPVCQINTDGRLRWTRPCAVAIVSSGAGTGFLSGLLGVGGGFVIVPALRTFTALPFHSAVATSLMTIALTSAGTVAIAVHQGRELPWDVGLPFMLGALAGMLGGRWIAPHIAGPRLQQGFAITVVLVATGMAVKAGMSWAG